VERSWPDYIPPILDGELPVAAAVADWIEQARIDNGHDNASLVLMHYNVTPPPVPAEIPEEPEIVNKPWWLQKIIQNFLLIEILAGTLVLLIIGGYLLRTQMFKQRPPNPTGNPTVTIPNP
jgi:hypothetical protein